MRICPSCGLPSTPDASFCARCGEPLASGQIGERRKLVTILFCDLVGSTELGERLDAELLRHVLSRYFVASTAALQRHGGQVEKFIGDAVLCVFGLSQAHEDDATRACRAACDLLSELEGLNRELDAEWGVRLAVRVGVNSGEVMAGDPSRGQALVTGDAVNTAARLEESAGRNEVLIGELTYRLVGEAAQVEPRAPLTVKGKSEPLAAYRLLAASVDRVPARGTRELVGRKRELERLRMEFEEVCGAVRAGLLVVVGDPGIGKSRLVGEFVEAVATESRAVAGRCASYGEGITYWPVREIVEGLVGDEDGRLVDLIGADPNAEWVASRVLRAVGRAEGALTREETFEAVARFLAALGAKEPLVVVIEDLHWAEPTLLDLLEFLPTRLADVSVLLLGTARPEFLETWSGLGEGAMRLGPLDSEDAEALLADAVELEEKSRPIVLAAAGGNPLFLEQLGAAARQGALDGLPPDLRALLTARLDRLAAGEREILEVAAVVGSEFWPEALSALLPGGAADDLPERLALLERHELISTGRTETSASGGPPAGLSGVFGGEGRFSFRHALIHEAAYRALPKASAAQLHERFAAFLEAGETRADAHAALVAWHLERAVRLRAELRPGQLRSAAAHRAAALLEEAGRRALAQDEPAAAANLLTRAAALAPDRASSRVALDQALERSRAEAVDALTEALEGLTAGDSLGGYKIEGVAGRGGMGIVYRASDPRLGRTVAVKLIAPALARDLGFRERFQRESRLAAQIEHPNVIPVYRAGEDGGHLFIAMRYVEGTDLAELLAREGALEAERAARLLEQVARALDAAHVRGLVHRDVKPGNVLIAGRESDERVYLTDFGLSVEGGGASGLTRTGQWVGTPAYAAPEQIRAGSVDARTDVYALGALAYHCLTGEVPFTSRSEFEMLTAHLEAPPPRPSAHKGVSGAFDAIIARAMAKDPAARYPSAGDLGRALLAASRAEPLPRGEQSVATGLAAPQDEGRRPGGAVAFPRRRRRVFRSRRAAALIGALAITGGAAALTVALIGGNAASTKPPREATSANENVAGRLDGAPIRLGQAPERVAFVGGYLWTMATDAGRLARIDVNRRRVEYHEAPIDLGGGLFPDMASGFESLWLAHENPTVGGVDRIEPASVEAVERVALPSAHALAVGANAVWVTTSPAPGSRQRGVLARIDPDRNSLSGSPLPVGRDPADVAAEGEAVWIVDRASDTVVRVDPHTMRIRARIPVGRGPAVVAASPQVVWVANLVDRTLTRIDPSRDEAVGAPVSLGKEIEDILLADGGLWVAGADATVTRLDAAVGSPVGSPIGVGRPPLSLAWDGKRLWVASASDQTVQPILP